jgi:hypothetical protein
MLKFGQAGPNHFTGENGESHPPVRFADTTSDAWQCNGKDINVPTLRTVFAATLHVDVVALVNRFCVWSRFVVAEDSEFHLNASEVTE